MSLTKSTRSSTKAKNKRKKSLSPAEQFQQQWQTVQELQQKSQRIEHEAAELIASVKPKIEASERGRTETVYRLTERILVFMQRKTLPQWCKQELLDWLDDNMMLLMRHPFADHLDVRALAETADEVMHSLWGAPTQPPQPGADGEDDDLRKAAQDIDIEDLFSKLDEAMADEDELDEYDDEFEDSSDDDYFEESFDHWQEERNHQAQQEQEKQRQLNKLLRTSNINKIFRKIARVIHPDKETDPDKKSVRHEQMSELLTVRDNKDIIGLFQLYQQHLGNAPLEELGEDLASATELLRHQADQLRVELANYEPEEPTDYYLYELFARNSGKTLANKIRHHVRELDDIIAGQNLLLDQMTSIKNVKPILEVRQAQHYFGDFDDYL